ncbi:MAG: DUF3145 domain-containing protein [Bowdeniella nasicola]|nr:DUF3145 domain-containing protein [Bowdeniella nasicola]
MANAPTRGVIFVHSAPKVLAPHVEWALGAVLGVSVHMQWMEQPALTGMLRAEYSWVGPAGTGAALASAIRGWEHLRYEVTEEASLGVDGSRWSHTPELGIFHAPIDSVGNMLIPEDRIRAALETGSDLETLRSELDLALGQAWDEELEPFRYAGAGAPVRWLHRVG